MSLLLGLLTRNSSLLPIDIDFTTLDDGALPSPLAGSTWAVVGGKAVNTPTGGSNLLTDPGLEATYTAGKCDTLSKFGTPATMSESADAHGGSKAQLFQAGATDTYLNWAFVSGVVGQWYRHRIYGKRTVESGVAAAYAYLSQAGALPDANPRMAISSVNYERYGTSLISTSANVVFPYAARGGSSGDTVIVDDGEFVALDFATVVALAAPTQADIIVKTQLDTLTEDALQGLVVRASTQANPANAIFVFARRDYLYPNGLTISVVKKIGTTYTSVMAETVVNPAVADAWFEVRTNSDTVQVFYNGVQVGSDLTVSDAELVPNKCHGLCSSGGNAFKRLFFSAS